jgi:glycosyltransferase involved in cell wall biosynthesis
MDARPTISVVIPTFEPQGFLIDTLKSVLVQDLGADRMQIVIVDDGSKHANVSDLLARVPESKRVEFREHTTTLGLAGNWNRAIGYAHGEFVHILHQDDLVAPGFYQALLAGMRRSPRIAMGFCRHAFIDENGRTERISHRERWRAGILKNWLERISERQRLQCPAAIIRRETYEVLGGFRPDLRYALDWEMWVRIAARYDVWYEPAILASYRRHSGAETNRLQAADSTTVDTLKAIEAIAQHLPETRRTRLQLRAYARVARLHVERASKFADRRAYDVASKHIRAAQDALALMPKSVTTRWLHTRLARVMSRVQLDRAPLNP